MELEDYTAMRDNFYKLLSQHVQSLNPAFQKKYTLNHTSYQNAIHAVRASKGQRSSKYSAHFKLWARTKFRVEERDGHSLLICRRTNHLVVQHDSMFDRILECHWNVKHCGRDRTWKEVKANYSHIPLEAISIFLKICSHCQLKTRHQPNENKPPVAIQFLNRVQVDTIDMTRYPDNNYKWILHARCLYSNFTWAYPIETREPTEVASRLMDIFRNFGPCQILHSNSGKAFVGQVIKELQITWPSLRVINGRCHPPQTRAIEKQKNSLLLSKLNQWMEGTSTNHWSKGLASVVYEHNTKHHQEIKPTPYAIVFGKNPYDNSKIFETLSGYGSINEDNLPNVLRKELETPPVKIPTHAPNCEQPNEMACMAMQHSQDPSFSKIKIQDTSLTDSNVYLVLDNNGQIVAEVQTNDKSKDLCI